MEEQARRTLRCEVLSIRSELTRALRRCDDLLDDIEEDRGSPEEGAARADSIALRAKSGWERMLMAWARWVGKGEEVR